MNKGFLVTFEGGEGCGKSTQIKLFIKFLEEQKLNFILSREPGGCVLGEKIRAILLHSKEDMSALSEFFLFCANRAEHVKEVIKPALEEGKIVVIDRYYDSSLAYQGYAGNLDIKKLKNITAFATDNVVPDLTFLLDISYEEGFGRKAKDENLKNLDRIEQRDRAYHEKVRQGYLKLVKEEPNRFVVIDASKSLEEIHEEIIKIFLKRIKK